jgi:hypothetical protein
VRSAAKNTTDTLVRHNLRIVKQLYPGLRQQNLTALRSLTQTLHLSISKGELLCIEGNWYVTHSGLLQIASKRRCLGIRTILQEQFCDPSSARWVFKATVYKSRESRGFVGYGDADPSNVSSLVHGAEMRIAETRAVNRALRKAYGIGLCSVEELGWSPRPSGANQSNQNAPSANGNNGHQNGQPRLRDRLCLLIRQHRLDASRVKAYAADYCGTPTLHDASREQVEAFINHLTQRASNDRAALLCHLNSYPKPEETKK